MIKCPVVKSIVLIALALSCAVSTSSAPDETEASDDTVLAVIVSEVCSLPGSQPMAVKRTSMVIARTMNRLREGDTDIVEIALVFPGTRWRPEYSTRLDKPIHAEPAFAERLEKELSSDKGEEQVITFDIRGHSVTVVPCVQRPGSKVQGAYVAVVRRSSTGKPTDNKHMETDQ